MKIVAIDPGYNGSGMAVWEDGEFKDLRRIQLDDLYEFFENEKVDYYLIEDSRLMRGNWHGHSARANVAKNKSTSKFIVDKAKKLGLPVRILKPAGYSLMYVDHEGKYSDWHKRLFLADTKYLKSTNKDSRAAAAMILENKHIVKALIKEDKKQ